MGSDWRRGEAAPEGSARGSDFFLEMLNGFSR
jgi:hypothetical protein